MDLFIVRHAWAAERDQRAFPNDALRPLTDAGRERFARMAERLVERGLNPRLIATSPLVRCMQTAEVLARAIGTRAQIVQCDELCPGGDPKHLLAWTEEHAPGMEQIAWVGHAPDLGYLAAILIGRGDGWIRLAKGSVTAIRFPHLPEFGRGELRWLVTAKILGC